METGRTLVDDLKRLTRYLTHALLVDIPHRERRDAGLVNKFALDPVNVTKPDQDNVFRFYRRAVSEDARQVRITMAQQVRQRHTMDVATR